MKQSILKGTQHCAGRKKSLLEIEMLPGVVMCILILPSNYKAEAGR